MMQFHLFLRIGTAVAALMPATSSTAQTPITKATISATVPREVVDGDGTDLPVAVSALPLDFFDDFSWRSFVALNWPAVIGKRGAADTAKSIKDPGPRVWETWKAGFEIGQPQGAQPSAWDSFDAVTPCSDSPTNSAQLRILGVHQRFHDFNQAGFGVGDLSGPLVCQNHTYTRYEVRVNEPEFNFIVAKKLYLKTSLIHLTSPLPFPDSSIEVKAAWREFTDADPHDFVNTFYVINAKVQDPVTGTCSDKRMGLVGLHIVHKTPLRPQWVWSSFEHVSNVPEQGVAPNPTDRFSYNDPTKPQATDAQPPTITGANPPAANPPPTQVVRELPLLAARGVKGTAAINLRYQQALARTVWANYMLVCTQWPTMTADPTGVPFPDANAPTSVAANTTLETYSQQFTSCMGCHDSARVANTDFVFFIQFYAFNDTGAAGLQPRVLDSLRETVRKARARKAAAK